MFSGDALQQHPAPFDSSAQDTPAGAETGAGEEECELTRHLRRQLAEANQALQVLTAELEPSRAGESGQG